MAELTTQLLEAVCQLSLQRIDPILKLSDELLDLLHIALLQDFVETVPLGDANLAPSLDSTSTTSKDVVDMLKAKEDANAEGAEPSCHRNISTHVNVMRILPRGCSVL